MVDPDPHPESGRKPPENIAHAWARYSGIAFILPSAVIVGLLLGALADRWFHTTWLIVVGIVLGSVAGFVQLIRMFTRMSGKE